MWKVNFQKKTPLRWALCISMVFITYFTHDFSNFVVWAGLMRPVHAHWINTSRGRTPRMSPAVQAGDILFVLSGGIRWHTSLLSSFPCPICAWDCLPLIVATFAACCKWLLVLQSGLIGDGGDNTSLPPVRQFSSCRHGTFGIGSVPELGLWRPLGNTIIENTSLSWWYQFNDFKNMRGIYGPTKNVKKYSYDTNSNSTLLISHFLWTRHFSTFALSKVSDDIFEVCL